MFLLLTYLPNITANANKGCQESLFFFFFFLQFFVGKYHLFPIFMLSHNLFNGSYFRSFFPFKLRLILDKTLKELGGVFKG